jgi:flagellar biosynthesis protein
MNQNAPAQAVALRYRPDTDKAPLVVAKGRGHVAEKILQLARSHQVPIREDKDLVQVLGLLDLNEAIPPEAYKAVAEILAFLYRVGVRYQGAAQQ